MVYKRLQRLAERSGREERADSVYTRAVSLCQNPMSCTLCYSCIHTCISLYRSTVRQWRS